MNVLSVRYYSSCKTVRGKILMMASVNDVIASTYTRWVTTDSFPQPRDLFLLPQRSSKIALKDIQRIRSQIHILSNQLNQ